jgi:hypothetical protein
MIRYLPTSIAKLLLFEVLNASAPFVRSALQISSRVKADHGCNGALPHIPCKVLIRGSFEAEPDANQVAD